MQAGREIKFRYVFKQPKTGEIQIVIITIDDMERNDWSKTFKWDSLRFELVGRQQFTGLHDKNGKEFYEGDVIQFGGRTATIIWNDVNAQFAIKLKTTQLLDSNSDLHEYEVIGNIYENPELLEVGNDASRA